MNQQGDVMLFNGSAHFIGPTVRPGETLQLWHTGDTRVTAYLGQHHSTNHQSGMPLKPGERVLFYNPTQDEDPTSQSVQWYGSTQAGTCRLQYLCTNSTITVLQP